MGGQVEGPKRQPVRSFFTDPVDRIKLPDEIGRPAPPHDQDDPLRPRRVEVVLNRAGNSCQPSRLPPTLMTTIRVIDTPDHSYAAAAVPAAISTSARAQAASLASPAPRPRRD